MTSDDRRFIRRADLDHPDAFSPRYLSAKAWNRRARRLREQILVSQGLWPLPERTPLNPVLHGRREFDGYTVEKVWLWSLPGHLVTGSLYRPTFQNGGKGRKRRLPGVLCPHGHWENGRFLQKSDEEVRAEMDSGAESTVEAARCPIQARCVQLARMGCVVFAYDMVGYANSAALDHRDGFSDAEAILRLQSVMGLQTWNSVRALDFLVGLPDVDPKRIGVTGASGGGTQTLLLGAVDDRIAAAFPAVMVSAAMQGGCVCENAPLLRIGTNNVEIAALFAPKPLGMTGADDWTQEIETIGLPELKAIYSLYGKATRVQAKHLPFPHNYNEVSRERMYESFRRSLHLKRKSPVKERPFTPLSPEELSVFDAFHPPPAGVVDVTALRDTLTRLSEEALERLKRRPKAYRRTLRVALRAMLHSDLPGKGEAALEPQALRRENAYREELGEVLCPQEGHRVPYRLLTPKKWKGRLIVWGHPAGRNSLVTSEGTPTSEARALLRNGWAVLGYDAFMTGELTAPAAPHPPLPEALAQAPYAGLVLGYTRSLLAERAHDTLAVFAAARDRQGVKEVRVAGWGRAGLWALLAAGLSGPLVTRALLDLGDFDLSDVTRLDDERLLPGAVKYGGVSAFLSLIKVPTRILRSAPDAKIAARPGADRSLPADSAPELAWLMKR